MELLNLVDGTDGQGAVVGQSQTVKKKQIKMQHEYGDKEEIHPLLKNLNKV